MRLPACLGGAPAFSDPLHVGQINLPTWSAFEAGFRALFERRFYANHGPLEKELDARIAGILGVRHAVSVANGTVGLMVAARALGLTGEVVAPSFTFSGTGEALIWAGLQPVFCDVDPQTHCLTAELVEPAISSRTSAILGVHLWGRPCDPDGLETLARRYGLKLFFDGAHAIGCTHRGRLLGNFGDAEVISFHATKVVNGAEGGCIVTNDDDVADRLRACRSFHDGAPAAVDLRLNAKISEAQALMALLSLSDLPANVDANRDRYKQYRDGLVGLTGIRFVDYAAGEASNCQYVVVEVDPACGLCRDELMLALHAENILARDYFVPLHHMPPFQGNGPSVELPVADHLARTLMQFPTGQAVGAADVAGVIDAVRAILAHAPAVAEKGVS